MKYKSIIDAYGEMAKNVNNACIMNGRYMFQKNSAKHIPDDVIKKLLLNKDDNLLDIGCGSGDIAMSISDKVKKITVCDHKNVLNRLKERNLKSNFSYVPENFLKADFKKFKYSKILIYAVLQALSTKDELFLFLAKVMDLVDAGGRVLIGDVPNYDKLNRFLATERGNSFSKEWDKLKKEENSKEVEVTKFFSDDNVSSIVFDDQLIFEILKFFRENNFNSYLLEQKHNLPFGNSREDIIVNHPTFFLK